jgi:DNA ligase-1
MIEGFRPMLFPNDPVSVHDIKGPYLMSTKLDGIRCLFIDGKMLSRKFKPIRNVYLQKKFQHMKEMSKSGLTIDGELYGPYNFPDIAGYVMSMDKWCPDDLLFYCFEILPEDERAMNAENRSALYHQLVAGSPGTDCLAQYHVEGSEEILSKYDLFVKLGFEGAILKRPNSIYKFGRITTHSGDGYKLKPMMTFDAIVLGVEQATQALPDSQRTLDPFGKSHTSHKQDDRELVEKAASFIVDYNGYSSKVSLAMTDEQKVEVWKNQKDYVGRRIEYKGMLVGSKDRVRHPVFLRFRDDL